MRGADDPIQPELARDLRAGQEVAVAVPELRQARGPAADELVKGVVAEHSHHLVGILDGQHRQDQPLARDLLGEDGPGQAARGVDG